MGFADQIRRYHEAGGNAELFKFDPANWHEGTRRIAEQMSKEPGVWQPAFRVGLGEDGKLHPWIYLVRNGARTSSGVYADDDCCCPFDIGAPCPPDC